MNQLLEKTFLNFVFLFASKYFLSFINYSFNLLFFACIFMNKCSLMEFVNYPRISAFRELNCKLYSRTGKSKAMFFKIRYSSFTAKILEKKPLKMFIFSKTASLQFYWKWTISLVVFKHFDSVLDNHAYTKKMISFKSKNVFN